MNSKIIGLALVLAIVLLVLAAVTEAVACYFKKRGRNTLTMDYIALYSCAAGVAAFVVMILCAIIG